MNKNKYQTEVIKNINAALIEQWKKLWERGENANIFNSYEWFLTCQKTFGINNYEINVCFKNNNLVAVLPVFFTRCFGIKVTSTIANKYVAGSALLVENYEAPLLKHFFEEIISKRNLHITKIDSEAAVLLKKNFPRMFFPLISVNPYLEINNDPLRFMEKKNLYKLNRILKKNADCLDFKTFDNKNNLNKYVERVFETEQKSAKKQRHMDLFSKKENRDLYRNIVKYCNRFVSISFLRYKKEPVAYSFSFIYNKTCLGFQTSYLFDYRKLSPGKIMTMLLLTTLKDRSIELFDFSGGISSYKREFTPVYYFQYNLYYSKNIFVMQWWKLINLARRLNQILFPIKHTKDHEFLFTKI